MSDIKDVKEGEEGEAKLVEVTGIQVNFQGGTNTAANLKHPPEEVAKALYASISKDEPAMFNLADPEKQTILIIAPEYINCALITSEIHIDTGRIVKPSKNVPYNTKPTAPEQGRRR